VLKLIDSARRSVLLKYGYGLGQVLNPTLLFSGIQDALLKGLKVKEKYLEAQYWRFVKNSLCMVMVMEGGFGSRPILTDQENPVFKRV
jgi:hypothetical protein